MRMIPILLGVALLTGCASAPKPDAIADYGPYPSDYTARVNAYLHDTLRDPGSVQELTVSPPLKAYYQHNMYAATEYGWFSLVSFNAKNSFGGYVGKNTYFALYGRSGGIARWDEFRYMSTEQGAFGRGCHFYGVVGSTR